MEPESYGAGISWPTCLMAEGEPECVITLSFQRSRYWQRRDRYVREMTNRQIRRLQRQRKTADAYRF